MADRGLAGPPPKEAVDYLRRKGVRTGYDYREVWREEHAHAFTVANMMNLDLLTDVQQSIAKAKEEGTTAAAWKKGMAAELAKRGWWGRRPPPDPNDPKAVAAANLYMSRRLDTIWRVNTRQAAQAGAWERGQRSTSHPYILYRVGPSKRHRDQHLAWDGVLLPKDDPFWAVANPMNGWGCKCYTRFVSKAQHQRYVRDGLTHPASGDTAPKGGKKVKTESPQLRVQQYRNDKTGEVHTGFTGIDPGFERNPGIGRMEQLGQQFRRTNRKLALAWDVRPGEPTTRHPDVKPVADGLDVQLNDPAAKGKAEAVIDAIDTFHSDGSLPRIEVIDAPPKAKYLGVFVPRWDPAQGRWTAGHIEIADTGPWPELTAAHEIGHFLDFSGLEQDGSYSSEKAPQKMQRSLRLLLEEIRKTATHKALVAARDDAKKRRHKVLEQHLDDMLTEAELLARSYAQYVAWRAGDATMLDQIDGILARQDVDRLRQWPYADYLPLIHRFDTLFEAQGWMTRTKL